MGKSEMVRDKKRRFKTCKEKFYAQKIFACKIGFLWLLYSKNSNLNHFSSPKFNTNLDFCDF
jgi:hypothetical protein